MKNKVLFLLILSVTCICNCLALSYGGCDYSSVSRMKSLVTNVNISYDYNIRDNQAYFNVTLNNISPEIYFVDSSTGITYTYSNTNNGEITIYNYTNNGGNYKFYSNNQNCYGISLGTKYYKFPIYNVYYNNSLCDEISDFSLCQRWINKKYSLEEFEELVNEYKKTLNKQEEPKESEYNKTFLGKLVDLYVNYYYIFLGTIIIVCSVIIFIDRRKNKFKL